MDTSSFFNYPTLTGEEPAPEAGLLAGSSQEDWDTLLAYTETRRLHPGDWLTREGEQDRALYVLSDGALEAIVPGRASRVIEAPATVSELAFHDGRPRVAVPHGDGGALIWPPRSIQSAA